MKKRDYFYLEIKLEIINTLMIVIFQNKMQSEMF